MPELDGELERLRAIVERIMTQHWDMAACPCWVCREGRAAGLSSSGDLRRVQTLPRRERRGSRCRGWQQWVLGTN